MNRLLQALDEPERRPWDAAACVFGNFRTACEKTLRPALAKRFDALAVSCLARARRAVAGESAGAAPDRDTWLDEQIQTVSHQREQTYPRAAETARALGQRNSLRTFVWGQKVTAVQRTLLARLQKRGDDVLAGDLRVHVCEACGFLIVKGDAPDICPVCKAPRQRFRSL